MPEVSRNMGSILVNKNILTSHGRTSIRLEPVLWDTFYTIAKEEGLSQKQLIDIIEKGREKGGRTSAVRTYMVSYLRDKLAAEQQEVARLRKKNK